MAVSDGEKIDILLAEYSTLRNEVLQRNSVLNQFLLVVLTGGVGLATFSIQNGHDKIGVLMLGFLPLIAFLGFKIIEFDTPAASARLKELEKALNGMAGSRLLTWETNRGLQTAGYRQRLRDLFSYRDPI
jgi:hypothetical protein